MRQKLNKILAPGPLWLVTTPEPSEPTVWASTPGPSAEELADFDGVWDVNHRLPGEETNDGMDLSWLKDPWVPDSRLKLKLGEDRGELVDVLSDKVLVRDKTGHARGIAFNMLFPVPPGIDEQAFAWRGDHKGERFKVRKIENGRCEVRPVSLLGKRLKKGQFWPEIPLEDLFAASPIVK
jgi:hypothetical protein